MDKIEKFLNQLKSLIAHKFSGRVVIEIELRQGGIRNIFFTERKEVT